MKKQTQYNSSRRRPNKFTWNRKLSSYLGISGGWNVDLSWCSLSSWKTEFLQTRTALLLSQFKRGWSRKCDPQIIEKVTKWCGPLHVLNFINVRNYGTSYCSIGDGGSRTLISRITKINISSGMQLYSRSGYKKRGN